MDNFLKRFGEICCVLLFISVNPLATLAQQLNYHPKILLVTAHPDDDGLFSATVFKTTHLLGGAVDLAIVTNGEGGYKYSTLGNYIYGLQLDNEEVGRANLPGIRKKEVMAGGDIVGLRNYYFFDEVDKQYSRNVSNPLEVWDTQSVTKRLQEIMRRESYDFVFTMMPTKGTHAHHKASALLTLRAIKGLPEEAKPLVLSTTVLRSKSDSTSYTMLEGYPITKIDRNIGPFTFDRTQKFGHNDQLDYNIIANWVIAEHKSQGTIQQFMDAAKVEQYWYYDINPEDGVKKVRDFFEAVDQAPMYTDPNELEEDE